MIKKIITMKIITIIISSSYSIATVSIIGMRGIRRSLRGVVGDGVTVDDTGMKFLESIDGKAARQGGGICCC